jgi:glycosyltransferase involved in cell wall biosynthesis
MRTVSVVIPAYQAEAYVPSLWRSFERAGVPAVATEIVFVDDGSTDGTAAVLQNISAEHPGRVTVVTLDSNQGRFFARLARPVPRHPPGTGGRFRGGARRHARSP